MKLKHILSAILISSASVSFANGSMPLVAPSFQGISKFQSLSSDFCSSFLHALSEGCKQQGGDEGICNDNSFLDASLRSYVESKGGVKNFCETAADPASCVTLLGHYINHCPVLAHKM